MTDNKKILVGKIVAPQGIRGEVRVQTYTESPNDFQRLAISDQRLAIRFIRVVPNSNVVIMKADGVNDRNGAESLRGTELYIDRDTLPATSADEYYVADLIGMRVLEKVAAPSAPARNDTFVVAVHNFGAGDILELETGEMKSFAGAKVDKGRREITLES
jgi:16S rRNA processing protein RimM